MSAQIFPDCWWLLAPEKYDECRITLRALLSKDLDESLKDVSKILWLKIVLEKFVWKKLDEMK